MPGKKKPAATTLRRMRWEFDPDIPTYDFYEGASLEDAWNRREIVDSFVYWLQHDHFLMWEAVVCQEQQIPLTPRQQEVLDGLLNFNDDEDDDPILYIDEVARPSEPWHVILNRMAPHLLIEPYRTFDIHDDVGCDGWNEIVAALREHGDGLSLPPGAATAEMVVPAELRHRLWLQFCFDDLSGLGQEDDLTLEDEDQHFRIESLIDHLRECNESVAFFGLTLESLLDRVVLPEKDRPLFLALMQQRLVLSSPLEPLADRL